MQWQSHIDNWSFATLYNIPGDHTDRHQWKQGMFNVSAGNISVVFYAKTDVYFKRATMIALDDVLYSESACAPDPHNGKHIVINSLDKHIFVCCL